MIPELYRIANYLELYILGSTGKDRSQIQVLNQYDPCCFAGVNYRTYEPTVKDRVAQIGGRYAVYLDSTHREHKISDAALEMVLSDLNDQP
jgi:hypothetical protein